MVEDDIEFFVIIPIIVVVAIAFMIPTLMTMSPLSTLVLVPTGTAFGVTMFYACAPKNDN